MPFLRAAPSTRAARGALRAARPSVPNSSRRARAAPLAGCMLATKGPLLSLHSVSRDFDVSRPWLNRVIEGEPRRLLRAVDQVSVEVQRGETLALVGESGCGKSTVARLIVGLYAPSEGRVEYGGRRMQMIFQDSYASLNPRWRVRSIIERPIKNPKTEQPAPDLLFP